MGESLKNGDNSNHTKRFLPHMEISMSEDMGEDINVTKKKCTFTNRPT